MADKRKIDFYSGIPWVYVDPQMARDHPKGKLTPLLWAIALYFLAIGLLKGGWILSVGGGIGLVLLNSTWPILTGIGLALRVPWSIMMAIVSTALTVWALLQGSASVAGTDPLVGLAELLINVGILFYLMDADRPNFIYRHRYRKYSVDAESPPDADAE